MKRLFTLLLILSATGPAAFADTSTTPDVRPNIVLIVVEDLGPRIGAFGDTLAQTPHLDQLSRDGVRFNRVFTTAGVCSPSRAALITGMHQQSVGAQHMRTGSFGRETSGKLGTFSAGGFNYEAVPPPGVKAFPELMRAHGYYTINNVKTDYQFGKPFTIWDEHSAEASWDANAEQPFFAMFSVHDTHESSMFRDGYANQTDGAPRNVEQNNKRLSALPFRTEPDEVAVPPYLPDTLEVRTDIAQHYDNILTMDQRVGEIIGALKSDGLLDNTIVIWTTDHGDGLPRAKRSLYDSGLHVPMIIRFPGRRNAGSTDTRLISFIDLAPTILAMAGIEAPDYMQGQDFLSEGFERRYVFAARDRLMEIPDRNRAIRDKRYKYIRNDMPDRPFFMPLYYRENLASMAELRSLLRDEELPPTLAQYFATPRPAEELYDTRNDPFELINLADDPMYEDQLLRLSTELDRHLAALGDTQPVDERTFAEQMWPGGVQPATQSPVLERVTMTEACQFSLEVRTEGSSLGYRVLRPDDTGNSENTQWALYTGPVTVEPGNQFEARGIRYGFSESPVVKGTCELQQPPRLAEDLRGRMDTGE